MRYHYWILVVGVWCCLAACQQPKNEPSLEELARLDDKKELEELFQSRVNQQKDAAVVQDSFIRPLDMPLDATVAKEVHKILAQHTPMEADKPMSRNNNGAARTPQVGGDAFNTDSIVAQLNNGMALVENGAMLINVRDYGGTYDQINGLVSQYGSMIVSEEERTTDFRVENTMIINTPPENFRKLVGDFRELATIIRQKRIWKQDLTAEFVDLESRITSKVMAQNRLESYMKEAKTAKEVLPIQRDLDEVTEELEALVRTASALTKRTAYSTVTLTFFEETVEEAPVQAAFGDRFSENITTGWANFKEFLITAANYWPYIAIGLVFLLTGMLATLNSRRKARQFRLQALQAQQQWAIQQQQMAREN
ncbi:MAG: DUF4349 domain-containing protein [Aureispira sp.]|nr:DUF4349 domain-containing protein [Aureispira sp.]